MPSHRMNSGTQAIDGIERSACRVGSSRRRSERRIAGDRAERACRRRRRSRSRPRRAQTVTSDVALQFAGGGKFDQRRPDARGRRHQAAVGEARAARRFPRRSRGRPAARAERGR